MADKDLTLMKDILTGLIGLDNGTMTRVVGIIKSAGLNAEVKSTAIRRRIGAMAITKIEQALMLANEKGGEKVEPEPKKDEEKAKAKTPKEEKPKKEEKVKEGFSMFIREMGTAGGEQSSSTIAVDMSDEDIGRIRDPKRRQEVNIEKKRMDMRMKNKTEEQQLMFQKKQLRLKMLKLDKRIAAARMMK